MDTLWFVLFVAALGALWWFAYRIDPHYASKDGTRFLCMGQELVDHQPSGRRKEVRVTVLDDGSLVCATRRFGRRNGRRWAVTAKATTPPKKKAVFVLRQFDEDGWAPEQMTISMPEHSRVVPVLEAAQAKRAQSS